MLLAGGQGSRLHALTSHVAKPAVPFGGKYRIIDFPLSNCINSGIDTVGVLTQYRPLELNAYIGNDEPWDLDRSYGGVHILPPYMREGEKGTWYKGTANAIYQNINFLETYDPEYVLILSGDHVYKMDYTQLLRRHKEADAASTIAVLEVPMEEASRFGIMNVDENDDIYEFEEKLSFKATWPPRGSTSSPGQLRDASSLTGGQGRLNDFGKNIIPAMLDAGEKMTAYRFEGYWKDVGTIDSLWDANMDMLSPDNGIDPYDTEWPIYARTPIRPPHFMGMDAKVDHSMVTSGCEVYGTVENSVLFHSVTVEEGAVVRYSILMPGTVVKKGAVVEYAIVAEESVIGENARVGASPDGSEDWGVAVIAQHLNIGPSAVVSPKAMITRNVKGVGVK